MRGALLALAVLAACAPAPDPDADWLAVGDSILAWHRSTGGDIPAIAARAAGATVTNQSVVGARMLAGIPAQAVPGDWDWVIVDGGGNDLLPVCGTAQAAATLDAILTGTGQGATADLARRMQAGGARIAILGYYPVSVDGGPFAPCQAELEELEKRQAAFADATPGVIFVDAGDVIDAGNLAAYAADRIHPSRAGAQAIGTYLAERIAAEN